MLTILTYIVAGVAFSWFFHWSTDQEFPWSTLLWILAWPVAILINVGYWSYRLVKFLTKRGERKGER